jgi:hypothetical protein
VEAILSAYAKPVSKFYIYKDILQVSLVPRGSKKYEHIRIEITPFISKSLPNLKFNIIGALEIANTLKNYSEDHTGALSLITTEYQIGNISYQVKGPCSHVKRYSKS